MSKNFVREIDRINNINKLDFNTNKVNDLLSTRAQNYIRTENRGYHCLTDNVKATRAKNVTYNGKQLITIDNTDVPTTNENSLNGQQLVNVINEMATDIETLENELSSLIEKQPQFHYVAEFAGNQFFNMQTTQTYNFGSIEIFTRIAYRLNVPSGSDTRNFAEVLESGATNFDFNEYDVTLKKQYTISGDDGMNVTIDSSRKGLDFRTSTHADGFLSGEIFINFKLTKKKQQQATLNNNYEPLFERAP